jgi:hypothetical protein
MSVRRGPSEYVYLIGSRDVAIVKIGTSRNVAARFTSIQSSSPSKLEVMLVVEGGTGLEGKLHSFFSARRTHGEWFDFNGLDPVAAIRSATDSKDVPFDANGELHLPDPQDGGSRYFGSPVWIRAQNWPGPQVGMVVSLSRDTQADIWSYEIGDIRDPDQWHFPFLGSELRRCVVPAGKLNPRGQWPDRFEGRTASRRKRVGTGWDV